MTTTTIPVSDPSVHHEERARLSHQSQLVLAAFQSAPDGRVGSERLTEIAQRFGARIHDLRRAGYNIEIVERDRKTGLTVYELQKEEQPVQKKAEPSTEETRGQRKMLCQHIAKMAEQGATQLELSRVFPAIGSHALKQAVGALWAYDLISEIVGEIRQGEAVWHVTVRGLEALKLDAATHWAADKVGK